VKGLSLGTFFSPPPFKIDLTSPRLLKETGRFSNSPVYVVGIFSGADKLGEGNGSSLKMAEYRVCLSLLPYVAVSDPSYRRLKMHCIVCTSPAHPTTKFNSLLPPFLLVLVIFSVQAKKAPIPLPRPSWQRSHTEAPEKTGSSFTRVIGRLSLRRLYIAYCTDLPVNPNSESSSTEL